MNRGMFFLPYQKKWILDNSRIKLMEKSRQIGISWATAYRLVRGRGALRGGLDSWVSSRDELQARLFIADCKKFADILGIAASEMYAQKLANGVSGASLEFADGTRIWSLSSNPDAQAGKRGARVLDEFALHPDPEKLYAVSLPGITWGGSLEIISTHRGADNFFNKLVNEARFGGNPKNISLHRVTLQDALEQGLLGRIKAALPADCEIAGMDDAQYFDFIKKSCADESVFMQEYMCQPADEDSRFLPYELIERCFYRQPDGGWRKIANASNPLYLGVDIGRTSDLTAFWLVEDCGEILCTRDVQTLKNAPFDRQERALDAYLAMPGLARACIDNTGVGRQFAERAVSRYGGARVEAVAFTQSSKELMAYPLKARFEQASLRVPDEMEIVADLHSVRRSYALNGGAKISAPRGADGHGDRFWALALANYARDCGLKNSKSAIELVGDRPYIW